MEFKGQYWFLSNMSQYPFDYEIDGHTYRFQCAEAAFHASKCPARASEFEGLLGRDAKELGKKIKPKEMRPDFNEKRLEILKDILRAKFSNPQLAMQLATIEGAITFDNNYHDIYWGLYNGRGQNKLGKLLTEVRDEVKEHLGLSTVKEPDVVSYKVQKGGIVAFDTETTGLSSKYDDVLQITIAGQDGSILLSTYVKPQNCTSWEESMAIHHITPEMVKDAPNAEKVAKIVEKIFDNADLITGYNVGFDVKMTAARFGYDFEEKELKAREKRPDEWKELVEKQAVYLREIRDLFSEWKSSEERFAPKELRDNVLYQKLKKEKFDCVDLLDDDKLMKKAAELAPMMTVCDILPLYRRYTAEKGLSVPHKLVDACESLCPAHFAEFKAYAHDAAADTIATIEVAKALCKKAPHLFNELGVDAKEVTLEKNRWGENKLFGLQSGILCLQVNCSGTISKGFTSRIYRQYPALKNDFFNTYEDAKEAGTSQFGKIKMFTLEESDDLQVASIYSQEKNGDAEKSKMVYTNAEVLVKCVAKICEKFPDKPVYLPCIMTSEVGDFEVVDGIGCGKAGEKWSKLGPMFEALNLKNLYLLDTQNGRFEPVCKEKEKTAEDDFDCLEIE